MESIWRGRDYPKSTARIKGVGATPSPHEHDHRPTSMSGDQPEMKEQSISELLMRIAEEKEHGEKKKETDKSKKLWKIPMGWKSKARQSEKKRDTVLVFFLNIKGEFEPPIILPIYGGNMIIFRNKIYEVDPRAMWTMRVGMKMYKLLIIKEIDRRPVSNLDLDEIRKRGDATDSDEFLIKAALRAQTAQTAKPFNKTLLIIIGLIVLGLVIFFFWKG